MLQSIFCCFCLILVLSGVFFLLYGLYCLLFCRRYCEGIYTVIYPVEDETMLPDKVYSACLLSKHQPFGSRKVFVVDSEVSPFIKQSCSNMISGIGKVYFIGEDELPVLHKIYENND